MRGKASLLVPVVPWQIEQFGLPLLLPKLANDSIAISLWYLYYYDLKVPRVYFQFQTTFIFWNFDYGDRAWCRLPVFWPKCHLTKRQMTRIFDMRLLAKVPCAPDDFWPSCSPPKRQEPLTIDTITPVVPTRGQSSVPVKKPSLGGAAIAKTLNCQSVTSSLFLVSSFLMIHRFSAFKQCQDFLKMPRHFRIDGSWQRPTFSP